MAELSVLLDENLPRRLALHFPSDFVVATVQSQHWSGTRNGELLRLAEDKFNVFITLDQNLEYQQNLTGFKLSIVLVRAVSNRLPDLLSLMPRLIDAVRSAAPGEVQKIPAR